MRVDAQALGVRQVSGAVSIGILTPVTRAAQLVQWNRAH